MREVVTDILVRYAETDQMGVVHHAVYPVYFEQGRTDFLGCEVMDYAQMEKEGCIAAVIDFSVAIKKDFRYGHKGRLVTKGRAFEGIRLFFDYELFRVQDNVLVATGTSTIALLDKELRPLNPRRLPRVHEALLRAFS